MSNLNLENSKVPQVTFKVRKKDQNGDYSWAEVTTAEIFDNKKVVLFALPGAFTPTCSSTHLPGYEVNYDDFKDLGIDEIYCLSVNDSFVMNAWAKDQNLENVKVLPDGNAEFTRKMGMLVRKENLGFGDRSWRYSMYVENGVIKKLFAEDGFGDNVANDPFEVSDYKTMLTYLGESQK